MPRPTGLTLSQVGVGRAAPGSVDATAVSPSTLGPDGLRVHVGDPVGAHPAAAISVADAGGLFASDDAEGALQEIASGSKGGRQNGLLSGGRFDEVIGGLPSTGFVLTLEPTEVLVSGSAYSVGGETVTLSGNGTFYVWLDCDSTSGTFLQLRSSVGLPYVSDAGVDHVLFGRVVASGGNVTSYSDARYFVRDLDRKVVYSVAVGETEDGWSQGSFVTLEAAVNWLNWYGSGAGTGEEFRGTLLVRGTHTVESTLELSRSRVTVQGDGDATLFGDLSGPIFRLDGLSDIIFSGLSFSCDGLTTHAIAVENCERVLLDSCVFSKTGSAVTAPVSVLDTTGFSMVGCAFTMQLDPVEGTAVSLETTAAVVDRCSFVGAGASSTAVGIQVTEGSLDLSNTTITDCQFGVQFDGGGSGSLSVAGGSITGVATAISVARSSAASVTGVVITTDAADGVAGVDASDATVIVSGCSITSGRTDAGSMYGVLGDSSSTVQLVGGTITDFCNSTNPADPSYGVSISGAGTITGTVFRGCAPRISGENVIVGNTQVLNTANVLNEAVLLEQASSVILDSLVVQGGGLVGVGVSVEGGRHITLSNSTVQGCTDQLLHVHSGTNGFSINGNNFDGFVSPEPTATAVLVDDNGSGDLPGEGVIVGNAFFRCADGVILRGLSETDTVSGILISKNWIANMGHEQATRGTGFDTRGTFGVGLEYASLVTVSGNNFRRLGDVPNNSGSSVVWSDPVWPIGIYARNCKEIKISDNDFSEFQSSGSGTVAGVMVECRDNVGAGPFYYSDIEISDNSMFFDDLNSSVDGENRGVSIEALAGTSSADLTLARVTVSGGVIRGSVAAAEPYVPYGVFIRAGNRATLQDVSVENVSVARYGLAGVYLEARSSVADTTLIDTLSVEGCSLADAILPSAPPTRMGGVMVVANRTAAATLSIENVSVSRNAISSPIDHAVLFAAGDAGVFAGQSEIVNVTVDSNKISGLQVLAGSDASAITFDRGDYNGSYAGLSVVDNEVDGSDGSAFNSIWFRQPDSAVATVRVTGNRTDGAIHFDAAFSSEAVDGLWIDDNVLTGVVAAPDGGVKVWLTGRVASDVSISRNKITTSSGPAVIVGHDGGDGWEELVSLRIDGNNIESGGVSEGIVVELDNVDTTTTTITGWSINDNNLRDVDPANTGISVRLASDTIIYAESIEVDDNSLVGAMATGVEFYYGPVDAGTTGDVNRLRGLRIDRNQFVPDGVSGDAVEQAIVLTGPQVSSGTAPTFLISNISVSSNQVYSEMASSGSVVSASFGSRVFGVLGNAYLVDGLKVASNFITCNSTDPEVKVIELDLTCNVTGLDVSGNTLSGGGSFEHGILIGHGYETAEAAQCDTTTKSWVAGQVSLAGSLFLETGGSAQRFYPVKWEGVTVVGNNIRNISCPASFPALLGEQEAALSFRHVNNPNIHTFVGVAVHGLTMANNVLVGSGSSSSEKNVGLTINVLGIDAGWISSSTTNDSGIFLQNGWAIQGNSVTNYTSNDSGTYYGRCVRVFADVPTFEGAGALVGNVAADAGAGSGWGEVTLEPAATAANLNQVPRAI